MPWPTPKSPVKPGYLDKSGGGFVYWLGMAMKMVILLVIGAMEEQEEDDPIKKWDDNVQNISGRAGLAYWDWDDD